MTASAGGAARQLQVGAALYRNDRIRTASNAKAAVELWGGTSVSIGPGSEIEVSDYGPDRGRGLLTLLLGIVRTKLSLPWAEGFEIRSRAAVAAVRSTDWIVEASTDHAAVSVVAGTVAVRGTSGGGEVVLEPGFGTDVDLGGAPTAPKKWGASRLDDALARTSLP